MKDGSFFQAEPGDSSPDMSLFQCPPVCFSGVLFSLLVQFPTCPVLCLPQELTWVFRSGPPAGFSLSGFSQVPIGLASVPSLVDQAPPADAMALSHCPPPPDGSFLFSQLEPEPEPLLDPPPPCLSPGLLHVPMSNPPADAMALSHCPPP